MSNIFSYLTVKYFFWQPASSVWLNHRDKIVNSKKGQITLKKHHHYLYKGLKVLKSSHPEVRKIKRQQSEPSAHGNKVWRSSFVMLDFLETYPLEENSHALEIGCGWGLAGLYLKKIQHIFVKAIDIDPSVRPYFELQNNINDCQIDFEARSFESLTKQTLSEYQYLIGTDICFWDELTEPLFNLIQRARISGIKKILIADPGRPPFWSLAELCTEIFNTEVITRRIYTPWKSEKYILVIDLS
jgi:predicted nicotinamide N-methyase